MATPRRPDSRVARASDSSQHKPTPAAPAYLASDPKGPEQYLSQWVEHRRITLLNDTRLRWATRATQAKTESAYTYAANRAGSLRRPLGPRVAACATVGMPVRCGGGRQAVAWRGCRQWWICRACRRKRSWQLARRLEAGMNRAVEQSTVNGWRAPLVRLLTLTVRHSGSVDVDRKRLADGWREFRKRVHRWIGRFRFALTWEVTPGRDGRGHVHAHAAVVWPRWIDYRRVRTLWLRSCEASERISIVTGNGGGGAAKYLAKYISKGVDVAEFTDELRAAVLASFYNAHLVLTSRKFWLPKVCPCCGEPWRRWYGPLDASASDRRHGAALSAALESAGGRGSKLLLRSHGAATGPPGPGVVGDG
jgi:hypothetical protein